MSCNARSRLDHHGRPDRAARGEEFDVRIGEPDAAIGPIEVLGIAAPAPALAVQAEIAAERGVGGRVASVRLGVDDPWIVLPAYSAVGEAPGPGAQSGVDAS